MDGTRGECRSQQSSVDSSRIAGQRCSHQLCRERLKVPRRDLVDAAVSAPRKTAFLFCLSCLRPPVHLSYPRLPRLRYISHRPHRVIANRWQRAVRTCKQEVEYPSLTKREKTPSVSGPEQLPQPSLALGSEGASAGPTASDWREEATVLLPSTVHQMSPAVVTLVRDSAS